MDKGLNGFFPGLPTDCPTLFVHRGNDSGEG